MARQLRWWIGATLLACGAIALLYLPPRDAAPEPRPGHQVRRQTAARLRAQGLAFQWRAADFSVRIAEYREQLEPELARRRATGRPGAALLIPGADTLPELRQILQSALDTLWGQMGLGVTKVSVGVVLDVRGTWSRAPADRPKDALGGTAYLLPDSTDRATCVALIPGRYWIRSLLSPPADRLRDEWLKTELLKSGLGPCAFYAAYGTPGEPVRHWLARRQYDLALHADWDGRRPERWAWRPFIGPEDKRWYWTEVYRVPLRAVACLGGRPDGCRAAVLEGADGHGDHRRSRVLVVEPRWWRRERLVEGDRYLADVAREVGHDRFARFWSSSLPVDTALAAALKEPVGEWTARWQRRFAPKLPLGAPVPTSAVVLGLLLAGVAVASVAFSVSRREVR
jgi:hypothetical protein